MIHCQAQGPQNECLAIQRPGFERVFRLTRKELRLGRLLFIISKRDDGFIPKTHMTWAHLLCEHWAKPVAQHPHSTLKLFIPFLLQYLLLHLNFLECPNYTCGCALQRYFEVIRKASRLVRMTIPSERTRGRRHCSQFCWMRPEHAQIRIGQH